jgi:hypothetical protein
MITLNALSSSIIESFETLGLSVEEIAESQGLDVIIVKGVLLRHSDIYRKEEKKEDDLELVTRAEVKGYLNAYKMLIHSEDDYLRERALRNLINVGLKVTDGIGESSPKKIIQELSGAGNILELNSLIQKAKAAKERALEGLNQIIDVESIPV